MGLFNFFKKKKDIKQLKFNKMWELWSVDKALSPYSEVMTYESEINNGGHIQFFDNSSNIEYMIDILSKILSPKLKDNLFKAYEAYKNEDEDILDECDNVFYENESDIETILLKYADTMEI